MQTKNFDFIIIGAGSGGIAAANRAAEHGAQVALIENQQLGGTCVNLGCVPKKIMWAASTRKTLIENASGFGFEPISPQLDWKTLVANRQTYIARLNHLYNNKLNKNKVTIIQGLGCFEDAQTIKVGDQYFKAPHILITTGAESNWPDIPGKEHGIDSDGFFALESLPKRVVVVGAGYIAVELAGMLSAFGSEVSLVYRHDTVLREFDHQLGGLLLELYQQHGMHLYPNHTPKTLEKSDAQLVLTCEGEKKLPPCDTVIWAIGRVPKTTQLNLSKANIQTDKSSKILVDDTQNTNVEGIYALGDVASVFQLTPVAIRAGRALSDRLFKNKVPVKNSLKLIPTVIFSHPPIATIGMSEAQAKEKYPADIKIYQTKFIPMANVFDKEPTPCFMKLITRASSGKVLGCHLLGDMVDEILQGFAVAINMGATKEDFDATLAIHPTLSEELVTLR